MVQTCIFCKITRGEIPVPLVYENEYTMAFIDLHPLNPGHTLVIPKVHSETFLDMADVDYTELMRTVRNVSLKIHAAYPTPRFTMMTKGFDVPHTHVHLFPLIHDSDVVSRYSPNMPPEASFEERLEMAERIKRF
jgi:histidine triad (HIT) family protein